MTGGRAAALFCFRTMGIDHLRRLSTYLGWLRRRHINILHPWWLFYWTLGPPGLAAKYRSGNHSLDYQHLLLLL